MQHRLLFVLAAAAVFTSGCASVAQQPVSLSQKVTDPQGIRIGVGMTALPKLDTQVPGASCLLCLAFASSANASLTAHAQTLPYEDLPALRNAMADLLRKKGAAVTVINEDLNLDVLPEMGAKGPNVAGKDFSSLQQKYKVDKLLVVSITALGFIRTYSAYIPTSDPKGLLQGVGYIVNLKNNIYEWYLPVLVTKAADQNWDEPPKFPGLTNAYFQALEIGKDSFLRPLAGDWPPSVQPTMIGLSVPIAVGDTSAGTVR